MPERPDDLNRWIDDSEHYVLCTNADCRMRYAYRQADGTERPHYHFIGSADHPVWDVP